MTSRDKLRDGHPALPPVERQGPAAIGRAPGMLAFASAGSAYWVRGAAEKSLQYCVYVLEDIHFNKGAYNGWKIAPDCAGSRKDLWQKVRCNFAEFLDHIWAPTESVISESKDANGNTVQTKGSDSKPDGSKNKWGAGVSGVSTSQSMISMNMGAMYADGTAVIRKNELPKQYGHTGNVDSTKFFPADNVNYFQALEKFGPRAVSLKDFNDAIKNEDIRTDPNNSKYKPHKVVIDKFNAFYNEAKVAASVIIDFRVQDKWRHIQDMGKWKEKLGIDDPVFEPTKNKKNAWVGAWDEINRDKAIDRMVEKTGIGKGGH